MTGTAQGSYKLGPTPPSGDASTKHATTAFFASYGVRVDISQPFTTAQQVQGLQNLGIGPRWSQFYAAIEAARAGDMRTVTAAVNADPSDATNIEFTHGSFVVVGGALWSLIQSKLGYSSAQMTALLTSAAGYPATGAAATASAVSPAASADAQAGSRPDLWMSPATVVALLTPVAVTAAGTTQATATALTTVVSVVTTAASGSGVILSGLGRQEVMSAGANAVLIYPVSGAAIYVNGTLQAVNAAITLQPGNHATFLTLTTNGTTIHYEAP